MSSIQIRVFGPLRVHVDGSERVLSKRRHREIIAILVTLRGRAITTLDLIDELWNGAPPAGAVGAVRTFIGELRRILEPHRLPRTAPAVLVTVSDGYALRLDPDAVDGWRFETALRASARTAPLQVDALLTTALAEWDGVPYQEFTDRAWGAQEVGRLEGLRQTAVERLAQARLDIGRPGDALALLEGHAPTYPWREEGWRLLALALYRSGRGADALAVLRTARSRFADELGLDPAPRLADLAARILQRDPALELPEPAGLGVAAAALFRSGARAQLEASNAVLGTIAVAGDLETARIQRVAAIRSAQELGDPELTARIIGGYDVPGIWTRSDDPLAAAAIINAAEQTLAAGVRVGDRTRARLLATIAMESRGTATRQSEAAEAEAIARRLGDAQLLCFALSSRFMQTFAATGLARQRADIGTELTNAAFDADSPTFEIIGRLIRMQALCALDEIGTASDEADTVDELAARHERPLASVFTGWFRHTFLGGPRPPETTEMPGFTQGLAAFAALTRELRADSTLSDGHFGPYEPWARPLMLHRGGDTTRAIGLLRQVPDPPRDLLQETIWCVLARTAAETGEQDTARRARTALTAAHNERAAGSAVADLGPINHYLQPLA